MYPSFRLLKIVPLFLLSGIALAQGQDCDVDLDGDIDILDISLIIAARNQPASGPDDPRDPDDDGFITVLDARQCLLRCSLPGCTEPPSNNAPVADAGDDQSVPIGATVALDGSGSSDLDGDPLRFAWRFLSIPAGSAAVLSDPASVMPTFVADVDGEYVIELIVNDGQVDSAPDSVVVVTEPGNSAPVADAGPDQTVQLGDIVILDGSGSTDVDGDLLTFSWSIQASPPGSAAALSDPTAVAPTFIADLAGVYVVELVVNDGQLSSLPDTVTITTANTQPVADAGPDQTVDLSDLVSLDGSGSFDADGDPLSFAWSLSSVPPGSAATLGNANTANPTFVADLPGTYVAQLIVNDGTVDSDPDTVVISTSNTQPTADAGDDQTADVGDLIQLDGSASSDPDGDPLTYLWSLIVVPAGSAALLDDPGSVAPSFTADVAGTYVVQLIVNDGQIDSDPDTATITVNANDPPTADAGPDQLVMVGDLIQLDGSGSFDPDGDPLTYTWLFISRPAGSAAVLSDPNAENPTFVADVPADAQDAYVVQLIVNDGELDSDPDTVTITTENRPPVADAGPDQTVTLGETVQLDGSGSLDPDGDALTFDWQFLSRPAGSTATLSDPAAESPSFVADVAADAANPYVLQLVVNDGALDSAPDTVTVTTENTPPVADAGPDQTARVGDPVQLDGSGSFDADGDTLTFEWSFVTRPPGSAAMLSDPTAENPTFVPDVSADGQNPYVLQLVVNDGLIDSVPDTMSVTTENTPPVADAGPDQAVPAGTMVQLDGSGSFDADGDPLTFEWQFVSRPAGSSAVLSDANAESPTFIVDVPADAANPYVLQLVVNDGIADSAPDTVSVTTTNSPPVADAGPDQTVFIGATVQLDGSGSSDADGDPLTFQWMFLSRPPGSNAVLSDPAAENPTFVADVPADSQNLYVVQLIVNDGEEDSAPDSVTISTPNPLANAGPDQTVTTGDTATLDGSGSSDPDGDPLSFLWSFVAVPAGSNAVLSDPDGVMPQFVADVAGVYTVQLVVNDGTLDSAPDTVDITATIPPPVGTPLSCGDLTPGVIGLPGETDLFTYTALAGELVSITLSETSNWGSSFNDARATVLTPAGDVLIVFDSESQQNVTLPDAGTYTISINANNLVSTGSYNLGVECILPAPSPDFVPLSCGDLASGAIDAPADVDLFAFSGQAGNLVSLTLSETSNWGSSFNDARATLFSPTGNIVSTFDSESQQNIALPENGTYIVRVNANNLLSTGSYNLGIECIQPVPSPDIVPLACGDLASNAIDAPADADLFSFDGQANDLVTFTLSETSAWGSSFNDARATVFSPTGDVALVFDSESQQSLSLPEDGTYIIRVNANNLLSTGSYNLGIECVLPVPSPGTVPLACGDLASDAIDAPADVDLFTFAGQSGDLVTLTVSETSAWGSSFNDARATVVTPTGGPLIQFDSESQQTLTLPDNGVYTVRINANNLLSIGSFNFGYECILPVPSPDAVALAVGDLAAGAIDAPADVDLFTFTGLAGDVLTLTISETSAWGSSFNDARATVITPSGGQLIVFDSDSQQTVTLPEAGTFTIHVNANNLLSTGSYNLGIEALLPVPSPDAIPIAAGDLVSDAIDGAADVDLFTFTGQAGDLLSLTLSETSNWGSSFNDARATVITPSGGQLLQFDSESQQTLTLPETGSYTIRVNANNLLSAGSYNLGIEAILPVPSPGSVPIGPGDLASDAIDAAADVDLFTFTGLAGDLLSVTLSETSNWGSSFNDARATVFTPTGAELIVFDSESQQNLVLPEDGTYTIRVNANNLLSLGTYNLGLESIAPVPSPGTVPIACGDTASDAIDAAADADLFTFTGQGGDNVTYTLTETSNWGSSFNDARGTIFSPTGAQLGLFDSDGMLPVVLPQDGSYVIRVNANNLLSTGSYDLGAQCP